MGQVPHGSATTTEAVRRAIQHSQASVRALAERYGVNPKTVAKWKKRPFVPSTSNPASSESRTGPLGNSKTQESRPQYPAFLQNRLLQIAANAALTNDLPRFSGPVLA